MNSLIIKKGDVLVVKLGIGNLPPSQVEAYIKTTRESLEAFFPPASYKMLFLPNRTTETDLTVIQLLD